MKHKVLIVSPHFPPINAPDHQRTRMALRHFREFGWEPVVLAVDRQFLENEADESLAKTIPGDVEIHRVRALSRNYGIGSLALRALPYLRRKGNELLARGDVDLIFFSTSLFEVMSLGPVWKKRFQVPYVLDFQDPWLTDYYDDNESTPPGGRLKYSISQFLGRMLEPRTVRQASHIVVVSPAYPPLLQQRHPELSEEDFSVIPFAAAAEDFESAAALATGHGIFDRKDGLSHWVYAGAAGPIMEKSLRSFFAALQRRRQQNATACDGLKIHFVGTDYADPSRARKTVEPIAMEYGMEGIVEESTDRLSFLSTLQLLTDADALLLFGSDDPTYTASKVFPYILAGKPLLAIVHELSPIAEIVSTTRGGTVVTFNDRDDVADIAARIADEWLSRPPGQPQTDWKEFDKYTARSMTGRLCRVFDSGLSQADQLVA